MWIQTRPEAAVSSQVLFEQQKKYYLGVGTTKGEAGSSGECSGWKKADPLAVRQKQKTPPLAGNLSAEIKTNKRKRDNQEVKTHYNLETCDLCVD